MWIDLVLEQSYAKIIRKSMADSKKVEDDEKKKLDEFIETAKPMFEEHGLSFQIGKGNGFKILGGKSRIVFYPLNTSGGHKVTAYYQDEDKRSRRMYTLSSWTDVFTMASVECPECLLVKLSKRKSSYARERDLLLRVRPNCFWCNMPLGRPTATIDHYVPLSRGGGNRLENLVLACKECNGRKGNDMPDGSKEELRRSIRAKIMEWNKYNGKRSVKLIA